MATPRVHIDVDPRNPAEFFACCGLLEVADRLWGGAEGWFVGQQFCLAAGGGGALVDLLHAIATCAIRVDRDCRDTGSSGDTNGESPGDLEAGKIAPLRLGGAPSAFEIRLDWWVAITRRKGKITEAPTAWKLWAGQQSSIMIAATLQQALTAQLAICSGSLHSDILRQRQMLSGRFGFDPGAAWNALDVGFSPNEQGMRVATSPAAELLSAVGLQRFVPQLGATRTFTYCTWGVPLPPTVAKVASAGLMTAGMARRFRGGVTSRGSYKGLNYSTEIQGDEHA